MSNFLESVEASWFNQKHAERKRRLYAVIDLSVELARLRQTIDFARSLAEASIEAVIEGDWLRLKDWIDYFSFDQDPIEFRAKAVEAYAPFRALLVKVYETRP